MKWSDMEIDKKIKPCTGVHIYQLDVLYEIANLLAEDTNQRQMLTRLLHMLEEKLEMSRGTIMLRTIDGNELVIEALKNNLENFHKNVKYRKGEGVVGKVLETGRPEVVPVLSKEPRFKDRIYQRRGSQKDSASFICVPIVLGSKTVGTLSVDLPSQTIERLQGAQRLLSIIASLIAHDVHSRRIARQERETLEYENQRLRDELSEKFHPENIIGSSSAMLDVFKRIQQVAGADTTVLIRGESGTGKELVASAIHYSSPRAKEPFIKVNCAALSDNLLESELFGHEKGAFTGALLQRKGRIEEAEGGTLFLDEIGDFSPSVQVKLLRVIQEREFERVGSSTSIKANVRIIAATNRDLEKGVREDTFRNDLYYRINVFPVFLPPLRNRKSDILQLANFFVEKYAGKTGKTITRISTPAINMLLAYHWPGNVRELENCIEYATLIANNGVIHGHDLPPTLQMPEQLGSPTQGSLKSRIASMERDMIVDSLKRCRGNISAAARELGITERMVRYKIQNLAIDYNKLFGRKKKRRKRAATA